MDITQALRDLIDKRDDPALAAILNATLLRMLDAEEQLRTTKALLQESKRREDRHWKLTREMAHEASVFTDLARTRLKSAEKMIRDLGFTPPAW